MAASRGLLTLTGGAASHGAVVARALGVPCMVGVGDIEIDRRRRAVRCGAVMLNEGAEGTIDGSEGSVYAGPVPCLEVDDPYLRRLRTWARMPR